MSKILASILVLLCSGYVFAQEKTEEAKEAKKEEPKYNYVGVKTCGMCHRTEKQGEQLKIWENSQHAQAYETLKSEEATKVAKEQGIEGPAYEAGECLKCHVTEYGVDDARLESKYVKNMGVQCESCHGPGSKYKKMSIMKDRQKSIDHGMKDISVGDGTAEELCVTCHNEESPTFKGFNFEESWSKITHPVPSDK